MNRYIVGILISGDDSLGSSSTITKVVNAKCDASALKKAKLIVKRDHPQINDMNIWSWHIENIDNLLTNPQAMKLIVGHKL